MERTMIAAALLTLSCMAHNPPDAAPSLTTLFEQARRYDAAHFVYRAPTEDDLAAMRALVAAISVDVSKGVAPSARVQPANALGFSLTSQGPLWILREAGPKNGGGFYVFRARGRRLCLQAPHVFFDEGTGELALAAFEQLNASCLFTNTVHRRAPDVAHDAASFFNAATQGLAQGADWPVLQLHGFAADTAPAGTLAIVSDGTSTPDLARMGAVRTALRTRLEGSVLLFGVDATVLGATTNVQGAAVRSAGRTFMHLELSPPTRKRLLKDPAPLVAALAEVFPE